MTGGFHRRCGGSLPRHLSQLRSRRGQRWRSRNRLRGLVSNVLGRERMKRRVVLSAAIATALSLEVLAVPHAPITEPRARLGSGPQPYEAIEVTFQNISDDIQRRVR